MIQGTFGGHSRRFRRNCSCNTFPANITAISLNPATLGKTLWTQSYPQAPNNDTRFLCSLGSDHRSLYLQGQRNLLRIGATAYLLEIICGDSNRYPPAPLDAWNLPTWYTIVVLTATFTLMAIAEQSTAITIRLEL